MASDLFMLPVNVLRIDKGYLRDAQHFEHRFITVIGIQFYLLNSDISVTVHAIKMIISVSLLKVLLEESMSQIFDIGPRYDFMSKIG